MSIPSTLSIVFQRVHYEQVSLTLEDYLAMDDSHTIETWKELSQTGCKKKVFHGKKSIYVPQQTELFTHGETNAYELEKVAKIAKKG